MPGRGVLRPLLSVREPTIALTALSVGSQNHLTDRMIWRGAPGSRERSEDGRRIRRWRMLGHGDRRGDRVESFDEPLE